MWSLLTPLYSWWIKNGRGPFDIFFHGLYQLYTSCAFWRQWMVSRVLSIKDSLWSYNMGALQSSLMAEVQQPWGPRQALMGSRLAGRLTRHRHHHGLQPSRSREHNPTLYALFSLLRPREESCGTCLRPVTARPASPGLSSFSSRQVEALSPPRQQVGDKLTIPLPF